MLLNEVFDRYEREVVPTLAERTQVDYVRMLNVLREHFGNKEPDAVRPRDIGQFLDVAKGHHARQGTARYGSGVNHWPAPR